MINILFPLLGIGLGSAASIVDFFSRRDPPNLMVSKKLLVIFLLILASSYLVSFILIVEFVSSFILGYGLTFIIGKKFKRKKK